MLKRGMFWVAASLAAGGIVGCAPMGTANRASMEPTSFAVYGDMPYMVKMADGRTDEQVMEQDMGPKIKNSSDIAFAIHVGDLGRPAQACSDEWLAKSVEFFKSLGKPVFYTPGDNDWTDCDRDKTPNPGSELARLDKLREIVALRPREIPQGWKYERQQGQPENETWSAMGIRFASQHIVSKGNGREQVLKDDPLVAAKLARERDENNAQWLAKAFDLAKAEGARAVVVSMQYDLFGDDDGKGSPMERCLAKPSYASFCKSMVDKAVAFGGPVLLAHGDTNAYCLDQPFGAAAAPKLWRLNAPGDFSYIDAAVVRLDEKDAKHPFAVSGLLSGKPAPEKCDFSRIDLGGEKR